MGCEEAENGSCTCHENDKVFRGKVKYLVKKARSKFKEMYSGHGI